MTTRSLTTRSLAALICILSGSACAEESTTRLSAYDFEAEPAQRWKLPKAMKEISGLALSTDGRLLAHDDEVGVIFELDPVAGKIVKQFALQPASSADFEGIAATETDVFLLISDGRIVRTQEAGNAESVTFKIWRTPVLDRCDFEGLANSPDGHLIIGCKTFKKNHDQAVTLFSLDPIDGTAQAIELEGNQQLRPTAIEYDRTSGHLLMLSSKKRRIVELTREGTVLASYKLDEDRHQQPEGLALSDDGTLYIADEGGKGKAHLAIYRPRS